MPIGVLASLNPGDIVIIEYNSSDPDQFSFLFLVDVPENEVVYFTDCGWSREGYFRRNEGLITYTVPPGGLSAGTVVTFTADQRNANGFTTTGIDGFFGLSQGGDQLLVFQGNFDAPVFLFGLNNMEGTWQDDATSTNSSSIPPGLEIGKTAVTLSGGANASFDCSKIVKDKDQMLSNIADPLNWNYSSSQIIQASLCSYSILPVFWVELEATVKEYGVVLAGRIWSSGKHSKIIIERSEDGIQYQVVYSEAAEYGPYIDFFAEDKDLSATYYRLFLDDRLLKTIVVSGGDGQVLLPDELGLLSLCSGDGRKIAESYCYGRELKMKEEGFTQNLPRGLYFFTVINNNGKKVVRKFYKY